MQIAECESLNRQSPNAITQSPIAKSPNARRGTYTRLVSAPRFFVPDAGATGAIVALPDDEATHLVRVLRLKAGDALRVFNGRGDEWDAEVSDVGKQRATVRLGERATPAPESRLAVTLAMAVLKAEKMDDVVRDAVMLGVTAIRPLVTARTEIAAAVIERSGRIPRWQRIAIASAKQCGRAVVPAVLEAATLEQALGLPGDSPSGTLASGSPSTEGTEDRKGTPPRLRLMLLEPLISAGAPRTLQQIPRASAVELIVGPEGGWTDGEVDSAVASGAMLVTLGGLTLRADAVPLVAITALRVLWGDL
jgi:16S rRNA (uracil1498-N3)-methyltransferase